MLINNEIVVKLMDSFSNPVVSNQSKLNLEVSSTNKSEPSISEFVNNNDGSYTVLYMPKGIGNYEICVTFHGIHFLPCPFGVRVYSGKHKNCCNIVSLGFWSLDLCSWHLNLMYVTFGYSMYIPLLNSWYIRGFTA